MRCIQTTFLAILVSILSVNLNNAQNIEPITYDINLYHTKVLDKNFFGLDIEARYSIHDLFGVGGYFNIGLSGSRDDFGYDLNSPRLSNVEFGAVIDRNIFRTKHFTFNARLRTGVNATHLSEVFDEWWIDEWGDSENSIVVARDYKFVMSPGVSAQLRLNNQDSKIPISLNTKFHYRKAFGNSKFGDNRTLNGAHVSVGVTIGF